MSLEKFDKNLKVSANIDATDIAFYNVRQKPFKIYGLYKPESEGVFRRLPKEVSVATSEGVDWLATNTAGGRLRFKTDSEYIAISMKVKEVCLMSHMAFCGSTGFDLYTKENGEYICKKTFMPPTTIEGGIKVRDNGGFDGIYHFESREMRDITINFPLYNNVDELYIGLSEDATVLEGDKYSFDKPFLCYGSSITQGGCASRPGNAYSNILSRMLDADVYNLGFSGSANGEEAMAHFIADTDLELFLYDYDHNAPNTEHLEETHEKFFKIIREKNPDLPVLMITRPQLQKTEDREKRKAVIKATYEKALNEGDKNVYFFDGSTFFQECGDSATVDTCHPNDLGFMVMAQKLYAVIRDIIKK